VADVLPDEVGPRFDCGIISPSFGNKGLFLKPNSYQRLLQAQLRDEVVGALLSSIGDRDIAFWKRVSQVNWQKGRGEQVFTDGARFRDSTTIDIHTQGQIKLFPKPTAEANSGATALYGRGMTQAIPAGGFSAQAFFSWLEGFFLWANGAGVITPPVWNARSLANATDHVIWMDTDGFNVWMLMSGAGGVWSTTAGLAGAAPAQPTLYDTGNQAYSMLTYDRLRKNIYAVTGYEGHATAARLNKINAGGAPTVVFDWLHGSPETVEQYLGNIIVGWNSGITQPLGANSAAAALKATLYKYDGTNVTEFAQMPDGVEITGLKNYLGVLYIATLETDPYTGTVVGGLYAIVGSTGPTRIATVDVVLVPDNTSPNGGSGASLGGPGLMVGISTYLLVPIGNVTWVYDIVNGGLSRGFGSKDFNPGAVLGGQITGILPLYGRLFTLHAGGVAGGVQRINGAPAIAYTPVYAGEGSLTASRMDAGLPYVKKYIYGWEAVFRPLLVGDRVAIDYSLDDGVTFTPCTNSPLIPIGGETALTFLTQKVNPHGIYRVTLTPANGDGGPIVVSVAMKYAVINPNASVYHMTVDCYDKIRSRGGKDEQGYAQDALAFLDNIARQNELVTFYEPNDPTKTARSCWVMSLNRRTMNTSYAFDSRETEGEVDIVLWDTAGS
jgi:hypothetical protein